jgi:hypothetical protein
LRVFDENEEKRDFVTSRNLSIQELVKQLAHYSVKMKKEALKGLIELCKNYKVIINQKLSLLLRNLLPLIVIEEEDIRKLNTTLFEIIFANTTSVKYIF